MLVHGRNLDMCTETSRMTWGFSRLRTGIFRGRSAESSVFCRSRSTLAFPPSAIALLSHAPCLCFSRAADERWAWHPAHACAHTVHTSIKAFRCSQAVTPKAPPPRRVACSLHVSEFSSRGLEERVGREGKSEFLRGSWSSCWTLCTVVSFTAPWLLGARPFCEYNYSYTSTPGVVWRVYKWVMEDGKEATEVCCDNLSLVSPN